jgi:hypothetical protein
MKKITSVLRTIYKAGMEHSPLILTTLIGVGGAAIVVYATRSLHGDREIYVRDIGLAFCIAGLLAATFEGYTRRKLFREFKVGMKELVDEVSKQDELSALKKELTPDIYQHVMDHLVSHPFTRTDHLIKLAMECKTEGKNEYVIATCTAHYSVANNRIHAMPHKVQAYLDESEFPGECGIIEVAYKSKSLDHTKTWVGEELKDALEDWLPTGKKFVRELMIAPQDVLGVTTTYKIKYPVPGHEIWFVPGPQSGLLFEITHPEGLHVEFSPNHPEPGRFSDGEPKESQTGYKSRVWGTAAAFLPYQSVLVSWSRP